MSLVAVLILFFKGIVGVVVVCVVGLPVRFFDQFGKPLVVVVVEMLLRFFDQFSNFFVVVVGVVGVVVFMWLVGCLRRNLVVPHRIRRGGLLLW